MDKKQIKSRIENQLRIHWRWLKDTDYRNVSAFINAIIDGKGQHNYEVNYDRLEKV